MTRVALPKPEQITDPAVEGIFAWVTEMEGSVPNHFYVELNFPEFFTAKLGATKVLWEMGELSMEEIQHVGILVSAGSIGELNIISLFKHHFHLSNGMKFECTGVEGAHILKLAWRLLPIWIFIYQFAKDSFCVGDEWEDVRIIWDFKHQCEALESGFQRF